MLEHRGRVLWKAGLKGRSWVRLQPGVRQREQRGKDCRTLGRDMLITRRKNRTSSQELSPAPTSAMLVSAEQWSSSSTLLHFAQLPALTPNAQEMFWSQPANHLKCLPRLWQIAQVALNMFKPHNKISACLRPSARFKGWEQGNVTYWQPGLGPSSLISNWVMRPCFMFLLKTARNCTRSFELPSSTVCMGSVRAPFTSLQAQTVQATYSVPAALGPGQPWHPPGQSAQPGPSTLC